MSTAGIKVNMTPSHPGDFVRKEVIEELGLSVTKASRILGVRRATLSDLLNGNTALTAKMALRIEKAFGVNMEMLLRMQAWHDACRMRAHADDITVQRYEPVWKTADWQRLAWVARQQGRAVTTIGTESYADMIVKWAQGAVGNEIGECEGIASPAHGCACV